MNIRHALLWRIEFPDEREAVERLGKILTEWAADQRGPDDRRDPELAALEALSADLQHCSRDLKAINEKLREGYWRTSRLRDHVEEWAEQIDAMVQEIWSVLDGSAGSFSRGPEP